MKAVIKPVVELDYDALSMIDLDVSWRDIRFGALPPFGSLLPKTNERLYSMLMLSSTTFISCLEGLQLTGSQALAISVAAGIAVPFFGRLDTLGQRMGFIGDVPKVIQLMSAVDNSTETVNHAITALLREHTNNPTITATESRSHQFAIFKIKNRNPKPISSARGKIAIEVGVDEDEVIFYQTYERGMSAFLVPLPNDKWLPVPFNDEYFVPGLPIEYIGEDLKGKPITVNRRMYPHMLYAGITNSGKSVGMLASIKSMRSCGLKTEIYIFDPKYDFGDVECDGYCNETIDGIEMLKVLSDRAQQRRQKYSAAKCKNYFEYIERVDPNEPLLLVYVDELAAILEGDKELAKEAQSIISMIVRRDRAGGLMATFAVQRPDAQIITGEFKSNLGAIVAFSHGNDVSSRVTLDASVAASLPMYGGVAVKTAGSKKIVIGRGCIV